MPVASFKFHPLSAWAAFAAVCLLWGTTYLGIRIAVETIPPEYLIAIRYTISGAILLFALWAAGARMPGKRELVQTGICGAICIGVGNGCLAYAETWVPSGTAALFYTTAPFWMVGIDALLPGGKKPFFRTIVGLIVGLAGVVLLILPGANQEGLHGATVTGFVVLQISAIGWVLGALLQKRVETTVQPITVGAIQQLAAGLAMFVPAVLLEHVPHAISTRSWIAVAYLVIFGSLVGFSCFIYSMATLPVAIVSVYMFVNPVVAVLLGWWFFREPFRMAQTVAMLVIFAGIAVVKWSESISRPALLEIEVEAQ